jgi:hypothetical protein
MVLSHLLWRTNYRSDSLIPFLLPFVESNRYFYRYPSLTRFRVNHFLSLLFADLFPEGLVFSKQGKTRLLKDCKTFEGNKNRPILPYKSYIYNPGYLALCMNELPLPNIRIEDSDYLRSFKEMKDYDNVFYYLRDLTIAHTPLNEEALKILCEMLKKGKPQKLCLEEVKLNDQWVDLLSQAIKYSILNADQRRGLKKGSHKHFVKPSYDPITLALAKVIPVEFRRYTNYHSRNETSRNRKGEEIMGLLDPSILKDPAYRGEPTVLQQNLTLNHLSLSSNSLTKKGAQLIAQRIINHNEYLRTLNLQKNYIEDKGAKKIAGALKHNNLFLEALDLSENKIQCKGAFALIKSAILRQNVKQSPLNLNLEKNLLTPDDKDFLKEYAHAHSFYSLTL